MRRSQRERLRALAFFFSIVLLISFLRLLQAEAQMTFGSQVVLDQLWTPEERQGNAEERTARQAPRSLRAPPTREEPYTQPASLVATPALIRRVELPPREKIVAFTFDLCEAGGEVSGYDAPIVDYLRAERIPATFFAGGRWLRDHPERAMQLMADPLFEVGNHSWSHVNLQKTTGQQLTEQVLWTQAQYELLREELVERAKRHHIDEKEIAKIPLTPLVFRFPYGTCSQEALETVARAALPAIQWDVVSGDPDRRQTAPRIIATVLHQTKPGSIVIFHANGRGHGTAEALPRIITTLRERGYAFTTVSALLQLARDTGKILTVSPACPTSYQAGARRNLTLVKKDFHQWPKPYPSLRRTTH